jgi:hypothetical protein
LATDRGVVQAAGGHSPGIVAMMNARVVTCYDGRPMLDLNLILEVQTNDPYLGILVTKAISPVIGVKYAIAGTSAKISLHKAPTDWDRNSQFDGTFTFRVGPVLPDKTPELATSLDTLFFEYADRMTIDGTPIVEVLGGNFRWVAVIQKAIDRRIRQQLT